MRIHVLALMLAACGGAEVDPLPMVDELAYDDTSSNLKARGMVKGQAIDVLEVQELEAIREYEAPAIVGTEEPDMSKATLVSIEVIAVAMQEGVPWEIQLDIKADDLSSFTTGMIEPSEEVEIEFELQNDQDEFKEDAQFGTVEIKHYADTGAYEGEAAVRDGGAVGGTFDLVLKSGAAVKGSFYATFAEPEVDLP